MSKKEKAVFALAENLQAVIAMVSRLQDFIKVHKEIAAGYQKYRKSGGKSIPGIEKHLGIKEQKSVPPTNAEETGKAVKTKSPKQGSEAKKTKKKATV